MKTLSKTVSVLKHLAHTKFKVTQAVLLKTEVNVNSV